MKEDGHNSFVANLQYDQFKAYATHLYQECGLEGKTDLKVVEYALTGYFNLQKEKLLRNVNVITIIDYAKPSTSKRFYVIDLSREKLLFETLVAHGRNSGGKYARHFSNKPSSLKSSLGFFVAEETYNGKHGYSQRLKGLEKGINNNARERDIVIHGADYVSQEFIKKHGRLGRSWGCPGLPIGISRDIIDTIKGGSCLFVYCDNKSYLKASNYLNTENAVIEFLNWEMTGIMDGVLN